MLKRAGYDDVTVFERGERVGGVWHHNTYPGAACDVPSHLYEFSFEPNPRWSRRYAPQAEIQAYLEDVARRYGVFDRIRTETEVKQARWDEARGMWVLETSAGTHEADVLVTACGQLSVPERPADPGPGRLRGPGVPHRATGATTSTSRASAWRWSAPAAARSRSCRRSSRSSSSVDVYQRSPGWTFPKMDFAYSERTKRLFERFPVAAAARPRGDLRLHGARRGGDDQAAAGCSRAFRAVGRRQINKAIADPELRRKVTPTDEIGCKRMMLTDDWYPTLDQAQRRARHRPDRRGHRRPAIRTAGRRERAADVLVLATGFKTHGFVAPMEIAGAGGRTLAEEWADVPRAYLGLSVPGFPNMFLLYGPNTNGGTGSVIYTIEAGMNHVIAALGELERADARRIEVTPRSPRSSSTASCAPRSPARSGTRGCTNWYVDADGNDPSQWPWLWTSYRRRTARIEPGTYALER